MSSINCFAVIHTCIFACLSLTLIDLLLNVRCMYPGIGNELWVWNQSLQYIIHPSCFKSSHRGRCDSIVFARIWCVNYVHALQVSAIRSCKSGDKSSNNLKDTYSPALMWLKNYPGCLLYCLDWIQWKLTPGFLKWSRMDYIHAYYLAWGCTYEMWSRAFPGWCVYVLGLVDVFVYILYMS